MTGWFTYDDHTYCHLMIADGVLFDILTHTHTHTQTHTHTHTHTHTYIYIYESLNNGDTF